MNLSKQVITLEQAKRLKELGIEQKSLWYYNAVIGGNYEMQLSLYNCKTEGEEFFKCGVNAFSNIDISDFLEPFYSAFTASECQLMEGSWGNVELSQRKGKEGLFVSTVQAQGGDWENQFEYYPNMAQAFAAKLIRSLENGYITPADCNKQLSL